MVLSVAPTGETPESVVDEYVEGVVATAAARSLRLGAGENALIGKYPKRN